jgi:hypothetical protein
VESPDSFAVDENLFYKGVDKTNVHGARLSQSHSLAEPHVTPTGISSNEDTAIDASSGSSSSTYIQEDRPPYPFESGASLLALTRKYNVRKQEIATTSTVY